MIVVPVLELVFGRAARLEKGNLDAPKFWDGDPVETAVDWARTGADMIHVTDIDAIAGRPANADCIRKIMRQAGVPVQVSGGIRSLEAAACLIDAGAARVVMNTVAATSPDLVRQLAYLYPDQIVLGLDVAGDRVMVDGWTTQSLFEPRDLLAAYDDLPLAGVVLTDVDAKRNPPEARLAMASRIASECRHPVMTGGMVKSLDDVARLKYAYNIYGCLIGQALRTGAVSLEDAIALAGTPERVPELQ